MAYSIRFARPLEFPCLYPSSIMAGAALASSNLCEPFVTTMPFLCPDGENTLVFLTLRKLSLVIDLPNLSNDDKEIIVSDLYNIQHRLLSSLNSTSSILLSGLQRAFQIAALIYLDHFIREQPNRSRLHDNLLSRLSVILCSTRWDLKFLVFTSGMEDRQLQWMKHVLMWIVFVALCASRDGAARTGFVAVLSQADPEVFLLKLDEVKDIHRRFVWRDNKCSKALETLWTEITIERLGLMKI